MAKQTIARKTAEMAALTKLVAAGNPDPASAALYRPAQMTMHDAMMAVRGSDRSDTWLRKMLELHKGAVAMSDIALANGAVGAVGAQVEKARAAQKKEIEHIEAMLAGEQTGSEPAMTEPTPAGARQKAAAAKPVPGKATAKLAPVPAEPSSPGSDEPKAAEPTCQPEHREAGHC